MEEITYKIHWLSFTVHAPAQAAFNLYNAIFSEYLGGLNELGHGGRGYKEIFEGLFALKLYVTPSSGEKQHFHIEIPGQACEVIPWTKFQELHDYLEMEHPDCFSYKRFDFAFDNLGFTPKQIYEVINMGEVRSLAKRKTLQIIESPHEVKDNRDFGTTTTYFGSKNSERFIRVYDKRGFTRLEFVMRDKRAHVVATNVLNNYNVKLWGKIVVKHLLDYVDFFTDWWQKFVNGEYRAGVTVSKPKELALEKTAGWVEKQVSPSLSVLYDVFSEETIKAIIDKGRKRRNSKLDALAKVK